MCGILQRGIPESPMGSGAPGPAVAAGLSQVQRVPEPSLPLALRDHGYPP